MSNSRRAKHALPAEAGSLGLHPWKYLARITAMPLGTAAPACASLRVSSGCRFATPLLETGGAYRDRTDDLMLAKQPLSQLS